MKGYGLSRWSKTVHPFIGKIYKIQSTRRWVIKAKMGAPPRAAPSHHTQLIMPLVRRRETIAGGGDQNSHEQQTFAPTNIHNPCLNRFQYRNKFITLVQQTTLYLLSHFFSSVYLKEETSDFHNEIPRSGLLSDNCFVEYWAVETKERSSE